MKTALICSVLAHVALAFPLELFKEFKLAAPVVPPPYVMVNLQEQLPKALTPRPMLSTPIISPTPATDERHELPAVQQKREMGRSINMADLSQTQGQYSSAEMTTPPAVEKALTQPPTTQYETKKTLPAAVRQEAVVSVQPSPLRKADEFLSAQSEKLSYILSLFGLPVGSAVLEAKNDKGEVRITLHVRSNSTISPLYPVDDFVEARHIGGNFILSRIRQQEGSFRGDRGFTIFLRDKSVFWIDRLKNLSITEPLPNSEVVDILSGFYYCRKQALDVGKSVVLQVFDSNQYAPTTVEVLRREHIKLPGLREADTLVIRPLLKTAGIFQRSGDILVWLTDDQFKVPVKLETTIVLGKVTAELVSAQTEQQTPVNQK